MGPVLGTTVAMANTASSMTKRSVLLIGINIKYNFTKIIKLLYSSPHSLLEIAHKGDHWNLKMRSIQYYKWSQLLPSALQRVIIALSPRAGLERGVVFFDGVLFEGFGVVLKDLVSLALLLFHLSLIFEDKLRSELVNVAGFRQPVFADAPQKLLVCVDNTSFFQ